MAENVTVKIKKGTFYISSKEDKGEGWKKQEFKNPQNKDETLVRYHKELSIKGTYKGTQMKDDKYAGKVCSILVKDDNYNYFVTIPIMDTGGSVKTTNQYFNSVVGSLEKLNSGDEVTMFINSDKKDKNDRLYRNIVVLDSNDKLIKSDFSFSDVPNWTSKEKKDEFGEISKEWDATEANKFYIDKYKALLSEDNTEEEKPIPKANPKEAFEPANKEDENDLPF